MARYVDADKLEKHFIEDISKHNLTINGNDYPVFLADHTLHEIRNTPTAEVVEVKHGNWVYWQPDGTNHLWNCSVCGGAISTPMKFVANHIKYCEHCGAKMDGERKCDK